MLELSTPCYHVEADVQDMIGLVVGEMAFEQIEAPVDGISRLLLSGANES
jgi:hypothetical protein